MSKQVLSITQLNEYIRSVIDSDLLLSNVAVCGEISNYKMYPSGHHYFTLKDENASLKCVMFRSSAVRLRFKPENGMRIVAIGKISVYPRDGAYQLYCTAMMVDGVGDLHAAFEQLKVKLSAQGLFDPSHKKEIPQMPAKIGIITSAAGAALHDMVRIINERFPLTEVLLLPVRVQGAESPQEIIDAIHLANALQIADVLIVGRGGGSIEDLWSFNDEGVARAIYDSNIPIISAVGHEPDVTISDYVADLRAATPSNAAELVVPDKNALLLHLDRLQQVLLNTMQYRIDAAKKQLNILSTSTVLSSPEAHIMRKSEALSTLQNRLLNCEERIVNGYNETFLQLTAKLDAMSPLKVLQRGYSITLNTEENIVGSVRNIKPKDAVRVKLSDGSFTAVVNSISEES